MKKFKTKQMIKIVVVALIGFAVIIAILMGVTSAPSYSMNKMKKQIPAAISFVQEHEESLNVILDIQSRLVNIEYCINKDEFYDGGGFYVNVDDISGDQRVRLEQLMPLSESTYIKEL